MWKIRYSQRDHIIPYNMAHARCMADNQGYRHILITLATYCFSTAKMVTWTRLICTFIRTFLVLFKDTDKVTNKVPCPPRSWKQAFTLFAVLFVTFRRGYWSMPETACSFLCLSYSTLLGSCPHALSTRNPHRNKSGFVSAVWWSRSPKSTLHIAIPEISCKRTAVVFAVWVTVQSHFQLTISFILSQQINELGKKFGQF